METLGPAPGADPVQHYLDVVMDKTGSLIATSARFGAITAGADPALTEVLTDFAETIGVAFQLADDILDVVSDSPQSGKTPGTDLREGVPTLPVLNVVQAGRAEDSRLLELLKADLTDNRLHAEALSLLRAHPSIMEARADCTAYAERARGCLAPLPDTPATSALNILCDVAVNRVG
jgi:heptaprenyl diphosphate synthase